MRQLRETQSTPCAHDRSHVATLAQTPRSFDSKWPRLQLQTRIGAPMQNPNRPKDKRVVATSFSSATWLKTTTN